MRKDRSILVSNHQPFCNYYQRFLRNFYELQSLTNANLTGVTELVRTHKNSNQRTSNPLAARSIRARRTILFIVKFVKQDWRFGSLALNSFTAPPWRKLRYAGSWRETGIPHCPGSPSILSYGRSSRNRRWWCSYANKEGGRSF